METLTSIAGVNVFVGHVERCILVLAISPVTVIEANSKTV